MKLSPFLALLWLLALPASAGTDSFGTFSMDFVDVDLFTVNDDTGYGGVSYPYQMGKHEVSRDMIAKANATAGLGLLMANMESFGGNGVDRPATGISWNEAARFVNYLNTSQGFQAAYQFSTQPGGGGYNPNENLMLWSSGDAWQLGGENLFRHKDAHYFLPSEDEWYKAAYYDGTASTYFDYATGSDTAPTPVGSGTTAGTAVYNKILATGPADIMDAGGLSPYGTMAQNGNVREWTESAVDLGNDSAADSRVLRGGDWFTPSDYLQSSARFFDAPTSENDGSGFRVAAAVPAVPADKITTLFAGDNQGASGGAVYFDVTVGASDLLVSGFDVNLAQIVSFSDFQVWLLPGLTSQGNETSGSWVQVATGSGTGAGVDVPTAVSLSTSFTLDANTLYGMALVSGSAGALGHKYTNGTGSNQNYSNADVTLALGSAQSVAFTGSVISPRVWNGCIYYELTTLPAIPGDMNGDGRVDVFDIDGFVQALVDPAGYIEETGMDPVAFGDINDDGMFNGFDIDPFVNLLSDGALEMAEQLAPLLALRPNSLEAIEGGFRIVRIDRSPSGLTIEWISEIGRHYVVERSPTAHPDSWKAVNEKPVRASEHITSYVDIEESRLSIGESYYRLRVLP